MKSKTQTGSAHVVIVVVVIIALLGALGFVFWNNFLSKNAAAPQAQEQPVVNDQTFCTDEEDITASSGTFCSEAVGVKFTVPSAFAGKLTKAANYEVFQGPLDPQAKTSAGYSEEVYQTVLTQGQDTFTLTIAKEPLRSGYVDAPHLLRSTYFDQATGELTLMNSPTQNYNSATNSYTTTGSYSKGDVVPSFEADGVRIFKGQDGDAGTVENIYFGVVNDKIVKVSLKSVSNPMNEGSAFDTEKDFAELDAAMKSLKAVKP